MLSIYNIWTIARFEIKTLSRSWFLRIFTALAFIILFFFNVSAFTDLFDNFTPRIMYGMSATLPYSNLLLFNVVQAVITVFLASDFLKRDKKLDTTEAIYIRSMTNSDYVLGKTLGIFTIFFALNIFLLLFCAGFNAAAHSTLFNLNAYIFYPLFISVPTLIFIIGISFLTMTLIRNQAVTFILLLGYISVTLFYLGPQFFSVFDYTGFFVPMLYSDFVGFGDISNLILLRGTYVLLGFSFIFLTMFMFRRLPQSVGMRKLSVALAVVFFIAAISTAYIYVGGFTDGQSLRAEMIELNKKYFSKPVVGVVSNNITLKHVGGRIECSAEMTVVNNTENDINEIIVSLNPGLTIEKITADGVDQEYKRELHIINIKPSSKLKPSDQLKLTINYAGSIDDEATYLDIHQNQREEIRNFTMYISQKKHSFIKSDYLLLTTEVLWYPLPGVTYNPSAQFRQDINFTQYTLNVKTKPGLTAVSQGRIDTVEAGSYAFSPEKPLPRISLVIGPYERRSVEIDSVKYHLYIKKDHNYFDEYMNEVGDTLSPVIREARQDYERDLNLTYSFPRFSIVEVPIQFTTYKRLWTAAFESTQPEMSFLPENGITIEDADFKNLTFRQERWGNRGNQVILPKEKQANQLKRFITSTLLDGPSSGFFRRGDNEEGFNNPFTAFPNYYSFANNLTSEDLPILNTVLEFYLKVEEENTSLFSRLETGLTGYETALQKFEGQSMKKVISDTVNSRYMKDYLKLKSNFLFTTIEKAIGKKEFRNLVKELLDKNKFKVSSFDELNKLLKEKHNIDINPVILEWYENSDLPGYFISNKKSSRIVDGDRERFQVQFNVTNPEQIGGYLNVEFHPRRGREGGRRFGGQRGQEEPILERIIDIDGGTTKKIGVVLDESPGRMIINTLISRNLPLQQEVSFEDFDLNKNALPFDGEIVLDEAESFAGRGEIIIDNEDAAFEVFNPEQKSWLKRVLNFEDEDEGKYIGLRFWRIPRDWRAAIHAEAYGRFVHSVYFTRAGSGDNKVAWNAELSQSGYYDVYAHSVIPQFQFRRRSFGEEKYQYIIHHDDGTEDVFLEMQNAEKGWNMLGSFYFSEGPAKIELTNDSQDGMIIADAVKWVLRK